MERLEGKFSKKTVIIIILALALILVGILLFSIFFPTDNTSQTKKVVTQTTPQPNDSSLGFVSPTPTSYIFRPKELKEEGITVQYPSNWQHINGKTNSGVAISLRPLEEVEKSGAFPRVDIIKFSPTNPVSVEDLSGALQSFGFKKSSTIFLNRSADKFVMTIEGSKFATGNPQKRDVKKEVYVFKDKDIIYEIDFAYYADSEEQFYPLLKEIVSTIKLD